jgi:cobalt/nickel transport system permease protein
MHIPDGFLDARTASATAALAVGVALRRVQTELPRHRVPLLGLTAAFVFAAQMLNFPIAAGTSGHLIGAVLAAVLLGPAPAVLVMTSVLLMQCFLFADGGLLALGANVFNLAIVAPVGGYAVYRGSRLLLPGRAGRLAAAAFASWCSTIMAAVCCAGELAWSGTSPWSAAFPAMANIHMLIGLGEAAISALVLASIARARPELLPAREALNLRSGFPVLGSLVVTGLAVFVAPFASGRPDGLERVAATLGFEHRAFSQAVVPPLMPDYRWPGSGSAVAGTILAGLVGTLVVFGLSIILARFLSRRTEVATGRD